MRMNHQVFHYLHRMQSVLTILFLFVAVVGIIFFYRSYTTRSPLTQPAIETERQILEQNVHFYRALSKDEKARFEKGVRDFLNSVRITAIKTEIDERDRVFVAAAAVIPMFGYPGWAYINIHEVLVYPGSFTEEYAIVGETRNVLGMVGGGAMQNQMILSREELRNGFLNTSGRSNTAIHEFVHLLDKTDGDADGVPNILFDHPYAIPWLKRIHAEMQLVLDGRSDINVYGATNEAEFLAVASEYFFTQPERLSHKHPELYAMLKGAFSGSG